MARSAVTKGQLGKIGAEIGIEGVPQLKAAISAKINKMVGEKAKKVFMRAALVAVDEIKDLVPVKTGKLKSAVFADYGDSKKPNVLVGMNYKIAPHAHLIEYGHGGPNPAEKHPYFRPGITSARPAMGVILAEGMRDLAEKK